MSHPPTQRRRWILWAGSGVVLVVIAAMLNWRSPVERARGVQPGMVRSEVHGIMGASQLRFKIAVPDDRGSQRVVSGECWDHGGVVGAYFDHFKRKLGVLNSFKTRAEYPVEIRFDDSDRVEAVEIHEQQK